MEQQETKELPASNAGKGATGFFQRSDIPVSLTYRWTDPPTTITFYCKLALADDDSKARQAFFALPDDDREKATHQYNIDLLCRLLTRKPENLPGFDDFLLQYEDVNDRPKLEFVRNAISAYLGGTVDPTPMQKRVAGDAVEMYFRAVQPAEFFR